MDDHAELQRSRDRLHSIEKSITAIKWRLESIEGRLVKIEPQVERMARADDIAEAVKQRIGTDRRVRFTQRQQILAAMVAAGAFADPVFRIVTHFSG